VVSSLIRFRKGLKIFSPILNAIAALCDSDWQVCLWMKDGKVQKFRVSPSGKLTETEALGTVLWQKQISPNDVVDATIVRVQDVAVYKTDVEDDFNRLIKRLKGNASNNLGSIR
jgi:hypothetical protein